MLVAALTVALGTPAAASGDRGGAQDIAMTLRQSRDALGAVTLRRGRVLLLHGTATVNGLSGSGSSAAAIGGVRFSERTSTPPIAAGDGYDGNAYWNQDQSGLVWTDGSDAGISREIDTAYAANYTLFVPGSGGAKIAWGGVRTTGSGRYAILNVTPRNSLVPMQVWIDARTHLPARYTIAIGPESYEKDVSEYRPVDGLMVAHRVISTDSEGDSSNVTVTSARFAATGEAALSKPRSHVDDFSIKGNSARTSVPFDSIDHHVYLNVRLNGKGPYRFVLDTGGGNTIDPAVANEIKAVGSGSAQDSGTGAGTESYSYATVDSLQIGDATLRHQVFAVEPIRKGFGVAAGQRVDGLIGFEVLARYVTTFDYATRTLTLTMPRAASARPGQVVHFAFFGTIPQVGCSIDGIPSQCTVDTGDAGSVDFFVPFIIEHPQVVPATHSAVGVNGYGVGGGHQGFMGRLRSIKIGNFALNDLVAAYNTQKAGIFASPFLAANLGGGVWNRFTVTFNYGTRTMVLRPNSNFRDPDTYDRSGMRLIDKAGTIVVYSVRQGTPAAKAHFAKGDVILSIDGVAPRTLEQARNALRGASGTVLHVRVADKTGAIRTVTLTLRDWV